MCVSVCVSVSVCVWGGPTAGAYYSKTNVREANLVTQRQVFDVRACVRACVCETSRLTYVLIPINTRSNVNNLSIYRSLARTSYHHQHPECDVLVSSRLRIAAHSGTFVTRPPIRTPAHTHTHTRTGPRLRITCNPTH